MSRAADDFATIAARLAELQAERADIPPPPCCAGPRDGVTLHTPDCPVLLSALDPPPHPDVAQYQWLAEYARNRSQATPSVDGGGQ